VDWEGIVKANIAILTAACAVIASASSEALAQDSGYSWSGFYAGLHAGSVNGDTDVTAAVTGESRTCLFSCSPWTPYSLPDPAAQASSDVRGMSGGVAAGYNWQWGNFIAGGEVDINVSDAESSPAALFSIFSNNVQIGNFSTSLDWYGSARARIGLDLAGGLMVYGTGGFAFGRVENSIGYQVFSASETFSSSEMMTGWTAGAGMEMQLFNSPRWRLKTEYLYTDLGESNFFNQDLPDFNVILLQARDNQASAAADLKFHTVRVGLNYAF
jgi:outer membrane immunogenic protein